MKTKIKILLLGGLLAIFSGCQFHVGALAPNTVINQNNFKIIGQVEASENVKYILMIGGNNQGEIFKKLKGKLYEKADLKDGQALANMTVDVTLNSVFMLYAKQTYTMTADVVEFK